jgi:glycosyltransferase involved in cell wall biosynthesis
MGHVYRWLTKFGLIHGAENINQMHTIGALKMQDFDIFHPTFYDPYFLNYINKKPWVITIHDMIPELFPQYFRRNDPQIEFKRKYLSRASAIIAVSENTKRDIVNILGIPEERISVIYHGGPEIEKINMPPFFGKPYFLYVGNRFGYKNFKQTLIDFSIFHLKYKDVLLICTGEPFTRNEKKLIEQLSITNNTVHLKVDGLQIKNLYAHALAFIYPSLYEGFGMPILEAFAYGCPALLNEKSCFPEIAGKAGIFFNSVEGNSNLPKYLDYMYNINHLERSKLINKGYERLKDFSWKNSSAKLSDIYMKVSDSNRYLV